MSTIPPPIHIPVKVNKVNDCTICLAPLIGEDDRLLRCTHIFHRMCIQPWEESGGKCPNCRAIIASPLPPPKSTESLKPPASPDRSSMLRHLPEPLLYSPSAVSSTLLPPPTPLRPPAPLPYAIPSPTRERLNLREFARNRPRRTRAMATGFRALTQYAYNETVTPPNERRIERIRRLRLRRAIDQESIISMLESKQAEASAVRRERRRNFATSALKGIRAFGRVFSRNSYK